MNEDPTINPEEPTTEPETPETPPDTPSTAHPPLPTHPPRPESAPEGDTAAAIAEIEAAEEAQKADGTPPLTLSEALSAPESSADAPDTQPPAPDTPPDPQREAADQLSAVYKAMPDLVPDLVGGSTVAEVQESLLRAQAAFKEAERRVLARQADQIPGAHGDQGVPPPPSSPEEMISQGLKETDRSKK